MGDKENVKLAKKIIEAFWAAQPPTINNASILLGIDSNLKKHIKAVRDLMDKALNELEDEKEETGFIYKAQTCDKPPLDIKNTTALHALQKELRAREIVRLHDEEKLTYEQIGALFNDVFNEHYKSDKYYNTCISPRTIGAIYRKTKKKESKK